ncbi:1269_t:CDS:2, partial [Entrophospora sp. SA101]
MGIGRAPYPHQFGPSQSEKPSFNLPDPEEEAKSTSAWSITAKTYSDVCNEVGNVLEQYIDLFHEYCSKCLELPLYKPATNHSFTSKTLQLKIPSTRIYRSSERPFLLLYNLPVDDSQNAGITDTHHLEEILHSTEPISIILGTSDMTYMIENLQSRVKDKPSVDNTTYATRYSKCLLMARVYLLHFIFSEIGHISSYNWTILQLFPEYYFKEIDLFNELNIMFRALSESDLDKNLHKLINGLLKHLDQVRLPVIIDEAVQLISSIGNVLCILPAGTGLSMRTAKTFTGSHLFKGGIMDDQLIIDNGFDSKKDVEVYLSSFGIPIDPSHDGIMQWLVGRARIASNFAEEWMIYGGDLKTLFTSFKERYEDATTWGNIGYDLLNMKNGNRAREIGGLDIMDLVERVVLKHWYTGLEATFIRDDALQLFEIGVARLRRTDKLRGVVNEPLIYIGFLWEQLIPDALEKLFDGKETCQIFKKRLPSNIWHIANSFSHKTSSNVRVQHSTSDYKLPDFLKQPISPFFLAETNAGPDIVTRVESPELEKKIYAVFSQAKLWQKIDKEKICNDDLNTDKDDDYVAVIDSTNCELVFDKEHLDVLSQLKNGKK